MGVSFRISRRRAPHGCSAPPGNDRRCVVVTCGIWCSCTCPLVCNDTLDVLSTGVSRSLKMLTQSLISEGNNIKIGLLCLCSAFQDCSSAQLSSSISCCEVTLTTCWTLDSSVGHHDSAVVNLAAVATNGDDVFLCHVSADKVSRIRYSSCQSRISGNKVPLIATKCGRRLWHFVICTAARSRGSIIDGNLGDSWMVLLDNLVNLRFGRNSPVA